MPVKRVSAAWGLRIRVERVSCDDFAILPSTCAAAGCAADVGARINCQGLVSSGAALPWVDGTRAAAPYPYALPTPTAHGRLEAPALS